MYLLLLILVLLFLGSCVSQTQSSQGTQTSAPTFITQPSATPTASPTLEAVQGTFKNQIKLLEKYMPRAESEKYVIPTRGEQADFAELVSQLNANEPMQALQLANDHDYRLNYYEDRGDEYAVSYLLREQRPIQKGWGVYAFRVNSTSNIIVEAPHPLYDRRTPLIAVDVYRALDARALLIAGAHRNANQDGSADVAHAPESIFQSIHESMAREIQSDSGTAIILQIHGFHSSKHEGYPQTVIGFGKNILPMESDLATKFEQALSVQGVQAGLCTEDTWTDLCGTKNVQGASPDGILFFHIELQETVRKNSDALIAALLQVFGK
jgi:hypothetical protein